MVHELCMLRTSRPLLAIRIAVTAPSVSNEMLLMEVPPLAGSALSGAALGGAALGGTPGPGSKAPPAFILLFAVSPVEFIPTLLFMSAWDTDGVTSTWPGVWANAGPRLRSTSSAGHDHRRDQQSLPQQSLGHLLLLCSGASVQQVHTPQRATSFLMRLIDATSVSSATLLGCY